MPGPKLADMPSMDDIKIGPGGQTFAQLKQAVVDARATWSGCPCDEHSETWQVAQDMLRAAYTRVGLPYVAP